MGREVTLVEYAPDQIALEVLARRRGAAGTTETRDVKRPRKKVGIERESSAPTLVNRPKGAGLFLAAIRLDGSGPPGWRAYGFVKKQN